MIAAAPNAAAIRNIQRKLGSMIQELTMGDVWILHRNHVGGEAVRRFQPRTLVPGFPRIIPLTIRTDIDENTPRHGPRREN